MSTSNNALTLNGATPKQSNIGAGLTLPKPLGQQVPNPLSGSNQPSTVTQGNIQGMINIPQTPKPSTPVKSTTIAHPNGTQVTTTYHAPEIPANSSSSSSGGYSTIPGPYDAVTGKLKEATTSTSAPLGQVPGILNSSNQTAPPQQGISQQGLIQSLADKGNNPSQAYNAAQNTYQSKLDNYDKLLQDEQKSLAGIGQEAIPLQFQQGRQQVVKNQYAGEIAGAANALNASTTGLGAANTQQGLQQGALSSAIGANAPVSQFGLLTNPVTGEIVGGNGSNAQQLMQTSLQKAVQLYNSGGADFNTALSISGLSQFGNLGNSLLSSALQNGGGGNSGGFNPTSQSTQIQTNQSNLSDTQKQAYNVNQNLQQVDQIEPVLKDFLQKSGVNPFDAQIYNGPVNQYLSSIGNPGAAASWGAQMGELKNFTSQLIASGYGGTPTGAEAATLAQDPSQLSYKGLQTYLETLKGLGNNRLSVLQGNVNSLGGSGVGYTGAPAKKVSSVSSGTPTKGEIGSGITSPAGQLAAGLGLQTALPIAKDVASGGFMAIGAKILKSILGLSI